MAVIFIEGFDKYGPLPYTNASAVITLLTQGEWTSSSGPGSSPLLVAGLSATGMACSFNGASATKSLPGNYSRLVGGFRFNSPLSGMGGIQFNDGATAQFGIRILTSGQIQVAQGSATGVGTTLATSAATVTASTTHYIEFDVTFANSGASYQIWLDGVSIISGSGDTTGSANNYANAFAINTNVSSPGITFDDIYLFDTTGPVNNTVLLTNPRVETTFPAGDSAVQFAFGAGIIGNSISKGGSATGSTSNHFRVKAVTPLANCTLASISFWPGASNTSIQFRPIVYSDVAGVPTTLLGTGSVSVGITSTAVKTLPLTTPVNLTGGVTYWIGHMCDLGISPAFVADSGSVDRTGTATFASGAPATAPTTSNFNTSLTWGNLSVDPNWAILAQQPGQGSVNFVSDTVVGHEDLYTFNALRYPPISISVVAVKAFVSRSDSGVRTVSMRTKSNVTDSGGSLTGQTAGPSFNWLTSHFELDPNGSIAWTGSALNAATSGLKIDS